MTHATRERRPRHTWPRRGLGGSIPWGPPEGGGVGESRPVKEGSRGRPGRHRHKTMTGPGKEGRTERRIGEQEGSENVEKESGKDTTARNAAADASTFSNGTTSPRRGLGEHRTGPGSRRWEGVGRRRRSDRARRPRPISHHTGKHDIGRGRSYYSAERRNTLP